MFFYSKLVKQKAKLTHLTTHTCHFKSDSTI